MADRNSSNNWWYFSKLAVNRASHVRIGHSNFALYCFWLLAGLLFVASPVWAENKEGDILITDNFGGKEERGALILIDPKTGQRDLQSDSDDLAQGAPIKPHLDIAVVPIIRDRDECYIERHGRYRDRHDCDKNRHE